ncbi:MAG: flavin reductase family protein [Aeromicrobium sp.]
MTIHSDHPFMPPEGERDPLRRFRGRLPAPVTVWATGEGPDRHGFTVSSLLIADGEPGMVAGLVDEDSDFRDALEDTFTVNILAAGHVMMAEAFAGIGPAPGGPFTLGTWRQSDWGPVLEGSAGWLGARVRKGKSHKLGWGLLVEATIEHVEVGDVAALTHLRGRYS